jgi:hypothetical protein
MRTEPRRAAGSDGGGGELIGSGNGSSADVVSSGQAAVCERRAAHDGAGLECFPFRGRLLQAGHWKVLRFLNTSTWYLLYCLEVSCRFPMLTERRQQAQQVGSASTTLRGTDVLNLPLYFLWMEAWEPGRLRCCFLVRMTVAFAASFTTTSSSFSAKSQVLADIADLVEASGADALAAKIREVPAGAHQMQKVVNLTRPWHAKTTVAS